MSQGARLRAAQEKREAAGAAAGVGAVSDGSIEEVDVTDEDDLAEDLGYISPLESVDPYETFKAALTCKLERPCLIGASAEALFFFQLSKRNLPLSIKLLPPSWMSSFKCC